MPAEFHFLRPWWLLALLPAALLLWQLWRRPFGASAWRRVCSPELLPVLLLEGGAAGRRWFWGLLGLGWLLAVLALAGPVWQRQPLPAFQAPVARVLVLDLSPSMQARDLKPDRLGRARFLISDVLARVKDDRTALVVFGGDAHVVVPLTDDANTISAMLPALAVDIMPSPGDSAAPALTLADELLRQGGDGRGEIWLLSDGVSDMASSLAELRRLRGQGVITRIIAIGTEQGAPMPGSGGAVMTRLNTVELDTLARAGGGGLKRLPLTDTSLQTWLDRGADLNAKHEQQKQSVERWLEQGVWLLPPLLLVAALGFRRGWLGVLLLVLLPLPQPSQAFGWRDLWWRADQQGVRLLEQDNPQAAAERFADPNWRASARYQAGDYEAAAADFSGDDVDSLYNRGNALARAGQLEDALAAYDQALRQDDQDPDVRFNRDLIQKLLEQQAQQKQQNQQDQQDQQGQQGQQGQQDQRNQDGDQGGQGDSQQDQANQQSGSEDEQQQDQAQDQTGQQDAESQDGSNSDEQAESQESRSGERQDQTAQSQAEQRDQAEADVADTAERQAAQQSEQAEPQSAESWSDRAEQGADQEVEEPTARPAMAGSPDQTAQPSEQDLALEQWLRQVPDDPAGLLRRKFMLEHLLRQQQEKGQ